jgi:hypothetical protein
MLDGQFKTPLARGTRGRRKSGFRFSNKKAITRCRLQKELKQRECLGVGASSRRTSLGDQDQRTEDCHGKEGRTSTFDITSLLSTVKELRFESSASEKEGRDCTQSALEEVSFGDDILHI